MKAFYAEIDEHLKEYENGTITISDDIEFSMRKTVKQITHYILSRYMGGQDEVMPDGTKRRKPFRNIGNAIVDIEWRAKNIDRKSIEGLLGLGVGENILSKHGGIGLSCERTVPPIVPPAF